MMSVALRGGRLMRVRLLEEEVYIHREVLGPRIPSGLTDHQR